MRRELTPSAPARGRLLALSMVWMVCKRGLACGGNGCDDSYLVGILR